MTSPFLLVRMIALARMDPCSVTSPVSQTAQHSGRFGAGGVALGGKKTVALALGHLALLNMRYNCIIFILRLQRWQKRFIILTRE